MNSQQATVQGIAELCGAGTGKKCQGESGLAICASDMGLSLHSSCWELGFEDLFFSLAEQIIFSYQCPKDMQKKKTLKNKKWEKTSWCHSYIHACALSSANLASGEEKGHWKKI